MRLGTGDKVIVGIGDKVSVGEWENINPIFMLEYVVKSDDDVATIEKEVRKRAEVEWFRLAKQRFGLVVKRRVNERDEETQDIMDEVSDWIEKGLKPKGKHK